MDDRKKFSPGSYFQDRLVVMTFAGCVLLGVGIGDGKWAVAGVGAVIAGVGAWWSVRTLDRGSTARKVGWMGVQVASFAIGGAIALSTGLDGAWMFLAIGPAMVIGWWLSSRILNGPKERAVEAEGIRSEVTRSLSLGPVQIQFERVGESKEHE